MQNAYRLFLFQLYIIKGDEGEHLSDFTQIVKTNKQKRITPK